MLIIKLQFLLFSASISYKMHKMARRVSTQLDSGVIRHQLKQHAREYLINLGEPVSPETFAIICNNEGYLETIFYSEIKPEYRDQFMDRTNYLARKKLSEEEASNAQKLAECIYKDYFKPKEEQKNNQAEKTQNRSRAAPIFASINTKSMDREIIDNYSDFYWKSKNLELLKYKMGDDRYHDLQDKVKKFLYEGKINQEDCGEFMLLTVARHARAIAALIKGNPSTFTSIAKKS